MGGTKKALKDAQSGSRRSLLNKKHRDQVDSLYNDIMRFSQIPEKCFVECFNIADALDNPNNKDPYEREQVAELVLSEVHIDPHMDTFDREMNLIIKKYNDELRDLDKIIMNAKLPRLKKELINFIIAIENPK